MLMDCLVYVALFFVVTGLALSIFYRCWGNSRLIGRTADDIGAAVSAGELWRDDVRHAAAPVHAEASAAGQLVLIPVTGGSIRYRFAEGIVSRQNGDDAPWTQVLARVQSSRMAPDNRPRVAAWRWELELKPRQKFPRMLPLFTFEAVPATGLNP